MKVTYMAREYPPNVYGGAGVHLRHLSREMAELCDVEVRYFGDQRTRDGKIDARGYEAWDRMWEGEDSKFTGALSAFSVDLSMVRDRIDSQIVHTHTWYGALAGHLARELYGVPWVATAHSLEPLRPWKEEQLGRAYRLSSWVERIAMESADRVVAVSEAVRKDILEHFGCAPDRISVIHNGIDLNTWKPSPADATRTQFDIQGDYILFVGRTSRQKGMVHLLDAIDRIEADVRIVFCTSAPDTKEVEQEIARKVQEKEPRALWINWLLKEEQYIELYSHCTLFCCPSIYEPFGIINLEAMACERPVVASRVGGIPEIVVPDETGLLVEPGEPEAIAEAINRLLADRDLALRMGKAGRQRVEEHFGWPIIARRTKKMYEEILAQRG
ncbi:MAG: glycogen synthase [Deltaproteobacteria bacterium]|nr:glycogen synthase [Deltaproteobacteria bacterium]